MPQIVLTPAERRIQRAEAHHLDPVVMIGADGLTDAVMRANGMAFWTDSARQAFQMEFSAHLANQAHLDFGALRKSRR